MTCGTFRITDIGDDEVDGVVKRFNANRPPPISPASKKRQPDGLWTVTAIWPPCPPNTSHDPGS
ncbi:MAG: hypothetical protein JO264_19405 [Acidisphaera sp.]|nr:hypothetical protein [Acidisphaera sp.]